MCLFKGIIMNCVFKTRIFTCLFSLFLWVVIGQVQAAKLSVSIRYNPAIDTLKAADLQCLWESTLPDAKSADRRDDLLKEVSQVFSIDTVMLEMKKKYGRTYTDIIVWMTNYYGDVTSKGLGWYANNIFTQLPSASMVWGANLDKWMLLANKSANLKEAVTDKISSFKADDQKTWIPQNQCPFLQPSKGVVTDIEQSRFRALQSRDFFAWLCKLPGSVKNLSGKVYLKLCRKRPASVPSDLKDPEARIGCTFRQLGLNAKFLDVELEEFDDKSILDIDVYCTFPLLQYLETIYYIYTVVCNAQDWGQYWDSLRYPYFRPGYYPSEPDRNIVFLVNIREILFYMVKGEAKPFERLRVNTWEILSCLLDECDLNLNIDIQPFAYGDTLFDAPYKAEGGACSATVFSKTMKKFLPAVEQL